MAERGRKKVNPDYNPELQHRFICIRKLIWKQIEMGRLP